MKQILANICAKQADASADISQIQKKCEYHLKESIRYKSSDPRVALHISSKLDRSCDVNCNLDLRLQR